MLMRAQALHGKYLIWLCDQQHDVAPDLDLVQASRGDLILDGDNTPRGLFRIRHIQRLSLRHRSGHS
ncbi:MAG: hypothetical protein ACR2PI_28650 [Hyphomicrobiaceae bacterium]